MACHSIRFSRFKLRRIVPVSCGFTRRMPPDCSWRRGDTLRTHLHRVNRFVEQFPTLCREQSRNGSRGCKTPPHRAWEAQVITAVQSRISMILCCVRRLPAAIPFQHRPRVTRARLEGVLYTLVPRHARESPDHSGSSSYPGRCRREQPPASRRQKPLLARDCAGEASLPYLDHSVLNARARESVCARVERRPIDLDSPTVNQATGL